jgi:hypothetical protein
VSSSEPGTPKANTSEPSAGDALTAVLLQITAHAERLAVLDQQVASLADRLTRAVTRQGDGDGTDGEAYRPVPAPRWWKLGGDEREAALARLRAWVEQVYRPSYGHLAAVLGSCWDQHPLCLYGLDWLMELWSVLYLTPERGTLALASQAEWQTRLLPALAEQMHHETTRCHHRQPGHTRPPRGPAAQPGAGGWRPGREGSGGP